MSGCPGEKRGAGFLVPVFVCGCVVGSVKPSVGPCVEGRCEDECDKREALSGDADDEDEGNGVHGDVSLFFGVFLFGIRGSTAASERVIFCGGCSAAGAATPTLENGQVG